MGFLDRAKKLADQAQAKLDDAQRHFNERQQAGAPAEAPIEYDEHGRPIRTSAHGAEPVDVPPGSEPATPPVPPPPAPAPGQREPDADRGPEEPPKLSSGDPLGG